MNTPQVLVLGSYNQDCVWRVERAPQAGETVRGREFSSAHGGKGFNQAVACARQGAATAFIAALGDDVAGAQAQRAAAAEGIAAHWQLHADVATGNACILVEDGGQNRIVVALGANERIGAGFLAARDAVFAGSRILLVQLENNLDATRAALERATQHGLLRILNPAPVHAQLDAALLAQVDLLIPNETECALLLGRVAGLSLDPATLAQRPDAELHALLRRLSVASIIVTLGAQGCFVSHGEASPLADAAPYYRVAAEPARVVDTTGAGDAFCGALAAALLRLSTQPLRAAVVHANRCAALATEARGAAAAMPHLDAVLARFGGS